MTRYVIKLLLGAMSHLQLKAFAESVALLMNGNLNYPTPVNPTLLELGTLITDFGNALAVWGTPPANRGSSIQHQDVLDTREALELGLISLSSYCMNTTPFDKTSFMSGGWPVKKLNVPVGLVGPVVGFHQFISRTVPSGAVKLSWKRPLEAPLGSINVYRVMHSLTADINAATQIGLTKRPTFTDLEAGNRPSNFYWIIPVTEAGNGGVADVVQGYPQGPVVA